MLETAIKATKEEGISQHAAAKKFGVSRVTMRNRMVHPNPSPHGGKAKLPDRAENSIADFSVSCSDMGVPLNRYYTLQFMSDMAAEAGVPNTSFNDKYFRRFLTRHENLSLRITHASNRHGGEHCRK
ncbi:hypothetical protein RvY_02949 [Ramazzottius varieornatus]|uniref:Uncharacterized protein n=1 Tax=Ramazzottius varieornatus TaxID=947166 RepID=A0A1D1UTH4_RAMVA|nr:hypothetical protein RvY_02949 [Ramazzottius varieornatus]